MVGRPPKRGRGRGRPPGSGRKPRVQVEDESSSEEVSDVEEANDATTTRGRASAAKRIKTDKREDDDIGEDDTSDNKAEVKVERRGRKRKAELLAQERSEPEMDVKERDLRCRDRIRSTSRYSPPPTVTRGRGGRGAAATPRGLARASASGRSPVSTEVEADKVDTPASSEPVVRTYSKRGRGRGGAASSSVTHASLASNKTEDYNTTTTTTLEVVKSLDNKSYQIKMPDGESITLNVPEKKPQESDDLDEPDAVAQRRIEREQLKDPEYVPVPKVSTRRKSAADPTLLDESSPPTRTPSTSTATTTSGGRSPIKTLLGTIKLSNQSPSTLTISKILTSSGGSKQVPAILKSSNTITTTAATQKAGRPPAEPYTKPFDASCLTGVKRVPLHKYLDSLPDLRDCVYPDGIDDVDMDKLPDRIMLVHSELPLKLSVNIENDDRPYLFHQVVSPLNATRYVCLLCKGIDVNFGTKEEKDILLHYQSLHELEVDVGQAKFSDEIVFICLPKMILNQFASDQTLQLNSDCQYCPEKLGDVNEMRRHYAEKHKKDVVMMEQEEILKMHHFYYCSVCKFQSSDFDSHMKHMKLTHQMKSYRCKSCVLVTQDEKRLRTHFKAKHMLHTQGQNLQCYYCHGLLIGVERLQKHIQQSHMVQTAQHEFSCIACLQVAGHSKQLLEHAQLCDLAGKKPEKREARFVPNVELDEAAIKTLSDEDKHLCLYCNAVFEDEATLKLHLHHEHMQWVNPSELLANATASVSAAAAGVGGAGPTSNGLPSASPSEFVTDSNNATATATAVAYAESKLSVTMMQVSDAISNEDMQRAKIQTYVGHWCRLCDQMIKVYQLYYLHMNNYHKLVKRFVCIITQCKQTFDNYEDLKAHIDETGHSQKSIITHPDEVFVCTYCDLYFSSENELIGHLITDQHINKFTSSGHFHRTEPRNFKCKACHTFFGMKESYIHHLETESHMYLCKYCNITTATACSRRAHTTNTHPDKLNLCEECGDNITDPLAHYALHGYSFECKKCVKKFYNREKLNAHMEVHQDPIECSWVEARTGSVCNRMIATRSMMVTHYRSHKSDHKCNVCGQAFWNFSMLSSHYRSHQAQRSLATSTSVAAGPGNKVVTRTPLSNRVGPSSGYSANAYAGKRPPILSNSVVKCNTCKNIFKSHKDLVAHRCTRGVAMITSPSDNRPGNKLLELANKATASQSKSVAGRMAGAPPANSKRRTTPKKTATSSQMMNEQHTAAQHLIEAAGLAGEEQAAETSVDEDTQLIMILNQATGELMEITAPKGMQVSDVINSLNLTPGFVVQEDDGSIAAGVAGAEGTAGGQEQHQEEVVVAQEEEIVATDDSQLAAADQVAKNETEQILEEEHVVITSGGEEAPTVEVINPEGGDKAGEVVEEQQIGEETAAEAVANAEGGDSNGGNLSQFIIEDHGGEQQIILPAECFNEDGTLTLDEETMARLSIQISPEGEIVTTHDPSTYV